MLIMAELEAKLFFPHMYRIKSKLIELKGEMLQYSELNKDKLIDEEKDSLRFYYLGNKYKTKVEHIGIDNGIAADEVLIL